LSPIDTGSTKFKALVGNMTHGPSSSIVHIPYITIGFGREKTGDARVIALLSWRGKKSPLDCHHDHHHHHTKTYYLRHNIPARARPVRRRRRRLIVGRKPIPTGAFLFALAALP
jgi:hypothetical protein